MSFEARVWRELEGLREKERVREILRESRFTKRVIEREKKEEIYIVIKKGCKK